MICVVARKPLLILFIRQYPMPEDECCSLVPNLVSHTSKVPIACLMTMRRVDHGMIETWQHEHSHIDTGASIAMSFWTIESRRLVTTTMRCRKICIVSH